MDGTEVAIRAVRSVGQETIAVDLETPAEFDALPGQFVQIGVTIDDESVARHYTLSSPTVGETIEVTVGVDPEGKLSPWLADAEPGTTVEVAGPFGRSYYEGEERVVVIGGGPGVGPAVGIAERAVADGNEVAVVYRDDEHAHEERLAAVEDDGGTVFLLDDDEALTDAVSGAIEAGGGQAFVYGFADFLDEAHAALDAAGYDSDEAKSENFG